MSYEKLSEIRDSKAFRRLWFHDHDRFLRMYTLLNRACVRAR